VAGRTGEPVTREEILQGIGEVARAHLGLGVPSGGGLGAGRDAETEEGEAGQLRPELRLVEDLALDSIQRLTLAVEVENRFRICLDPEDEEGIETVGDLAEVVGRKLEEGPQDG
jgi:acyl carrier protein